MFQKLRDSKFVLGFLFAALIGATNSDTLAGTDTDGASSKGQVMNSSKEIATQMLRNLEMKDIDAWAKLWDENGVQEMPFSPEGFSRRLEGKTALYNQDKDLPKNFSEMKFPIKRISTLEDPEWVVMEYGGLIKLKAGGEYNNSYISLLHIKNGKILLLKEYFDPIILQTAFGTNLQRNFNVKKDGKK